MMNQKKPQDYREQHRRDVIWQIWLPVGLGAIALLALGLLAAFSLQTGADASMRWGHIAAIWLILPVFILGFFALFLLAGLIFAVVKVRSVIPGYSAIVQMYARIAAEKIHSLADKSVKPIMQVNSTQAGLRRFWVAFRYFILGGYHD